MMIVNCFQCRSLEIPHNFPNPTHNYSTANVQNCTNNIHNVYWSVWIISDSKQIYLLWRKVSLTVNLLVIVNQFCLSQNSSKSVNKSLSAYIYVLSTVYPLLIPTFTLSISTISHFPIRWQLNILLSLSLPLLQIINFVHLYLLCSLVTVLLTSLLAPH
jgi:hypothetical protein